MERPIVSAADFLDGLFNQFYTLVHTNLDDNYDAFRFSFDGVDRSSVFRRALHSRYLRVLAQNGEAFFEAWLGLSDPSSRDLFLRLVLYRLLGHHHVRIHPDFTWTREKALHEEADHFRTGPSALPIQGAFGSLSHFADVPFDQHRLALDCWTGGVVSIFFKRQYFLDRGEARVRPEPGDHVIDAGCCLGESAVAFGAAVGPAGRVYGFDPLPDHLDALCHNAAQNGMEDWVRGFAYAVGERVRQAPALPRGGGVQPGFTVEKQTAPLPTMSLDAFVEAERVPRVDFIKMDIEGSELTALRGAVETLQRFRPKLAISLYHRPEDFIVIPRFLRCLLPDYVFHLEHYSLHAEETVLYGRPR